MPAPRTTRAAETAHIANRRNISAPGIEEFQLKLYHLEVGFGRAAIRAAPGFGHVLPACARRYAFVGHACRLVVNKRTESALPSLKLGCCLCARCFAFLPCLEAGIVENDRFQSILAGVYLKRILVR